MKDLQPAQVLAEPALRVRATTDPNDRQQLTQWLEAEHFLGAFQPVGHTLFQIVAQADQAVAVLVWAASAYHLKDREAWIGWDRLTCASRRNLKRHRGDFYVPNERPKRLWVKALRPDARARLCAPTLAPEHAAGQTPGAGARCALKAKELYSLAQAYRQVPDPRSRGGLQYPLRAILTVLALGLLLGRKHLAEILRDGQRLSQSQRARIGFRQRRGTHCVPTPCYNVYREVLQRIDLDALAQVLTHWLSAQRGQLPATLADDGKTIRDRLGLIVTWLDIEEGVPVAVAAEPKGKGHEMTCARKLLNSVPLENVTVIADSLHTNAQNAHHIVSQKGGDYIAALKDNQPNLHALAHRKLDGTSPLLPNAKPAVALSRSARRGS